MRIILLAVLSAYLLFIFYLAYCAIWEARRVGKLAMTPLLVRGVVYSILAIGVVADVLFNFIVGTALFLELPHVKKPMFTQRCKRHLESADFRGRIARWVCYGWLNPFQGGHC